MIERVECARGKRDRMGLIGDGGFVEFDGREREFDKFSCCDSSGACGDFFFIFRVALLTGLFSLPIENYFRCVWTLGDDARTRGRND